MLNGILILYVVGTLAVLFCLGIATWALAVGIRQIGKSNDGKNWQTTPGKVLSNQVKEVFKNPGDGYRLFQPEVIYTYQVGGQVFEGQKIMVGDDPIGLQKNMQEIAARYPAESEVTVYYNPGNPSESILERKSFQAPRSILLAIMFFFVAVSIACYMLAVTIGR